jgi:hypothetical protein
MALQAYALKFLQPYLYNASVLSLAYPDLLAEPHHAEEMFGYVPKKFTKYGKAHGINRDLIDTQELFDAVGATLRCIDVAKLRGVEDIVDLNEPQDLGKYDVVINPGTLEHCFNIGVALISTSEAVKVGGIIYHEMPIGMINHGFYNACPTLLWDLYTQNNWTIELFCIATVKGLRVVDAEVARKRWNTWIGSHMIVLAKRMSADKLKWPIQSKYLKMLGPK